MKRNDDVAQQQAVKFREKEARQIMTRGSPYTPPPVPWSIAPLIWGREEESGVHMIALASEEQVVVGCWA